MLSVSSVWTGTTRSTMKSVVRDRVSPLVFEYVGDSIGSQYLNMHAIDDR